MGRAKAPKARQREPRQRQATSVTKGVVERLKEQTQPQQQHPDPYTLVDITAGAEVAAALEILSTERTAAKVYELAVNALGLAQQEIDQMLEHTSSESRPACSAGCAYCCAIPVAVSPPEALYIAACLRATLSAVEQVEVRARLRTRVEERQGWTVDERWAHKRFCIFLREDRRCGIYSIRPLACRGYNSLSQAACETAFTDKGDWVRVHAGVRELAAGVIYGLVLVSKELGLEWGRHEIEAAVLRALETPDAAERWARGEQVFAGCDQISMPAHAARRIMELNHVSRSPGATPEDDASGPSLP
jgi:Fe-S-cluster containining protein